MKDESDEEIKCNNDCNKYDSIELKCFGFIKYYHNIIIDK